MVKFSEIAPILATNRSLKAEVLVRYCLVELPQPVSKPVE